MGKYELALVFRPELDEDGIKTELEKVTALIERFSGVIEKTDSWGKRRLSYEIKDQNEGIYNFITFTSGKEAPAELEPRIRIMESILRYLVIRLDEVLV